MSVKSRRQAVDRHRDTLETLAEFDAEAIADLSTAASELLADVAAEEGPA